MHAEVGLNGMTYDEYLKQVLIYKLKREKNLNTISADLHIPMRKLLEQVRKRKESSGRRKTKKT